MVSSVSSLVEVAAQFALLPTRVLQVGPGRAVAQVRDDEGNLFLLKTDDAPGALTGDVKANRILSAAGVPVPEIVEYRDDLRSVLILRWIDGEPISSASPLQTQRHVGRLLRAVHELPGGPPFSGQPTIHSWITAWTEEVMAWWPSARGNKIQVRQVRNWLEELEPILGRRESCLTLFDGRADHFLVRNGELVGVIDLHDVGSGDPAMDLAVVGLTDAGLIPGVLNGYLTEHEQDIDLRTLIPFYLLLRRLAGAEWHQRNGSASEGERLLRLATLSLSNVDQNPHRFDA